MKEKIKNLCEEGIANDGVIDCTEEIVKCNNIDCNICPFSYKYNNSFCYSREPETNITIAKACINDYYKESYIDMYNQVNSPTYYNVGKIEVIEAIEEWKLNFNLGNAIKYIARCEHKENKKQDLEKAKWYIERELRKC